VVARPVAAGVEAVYGGCSDLNPYHRYHAFSDFIALPRRYGWPNRTLNTNPCARSSKGIVERSDRGGQPPAEEW
jgi:hypothetical protein